MSHKDWDAFLRALSFAQVARDGVFMAEQFGVGLSEAKTTYRKATGDLDLAYRNLPCDD